MTAPAAAQTVRPGWLSPSQEERGGSRQQLRPIREISEMLRARFGGEYVSHRVEGGERPIYVVRWRMRDGVSTEDFHVDAATGQLLR